MKKLFSCLFGLFCMSASPAFALTLLDNQAWGLNISLYGQLNAEFRWVDLHLDKEPGRVGFNDGIYQPSYLGLRLEKQFGSLLVGKQLEVEARIDTMADVPEIKARQLALYLEGGWGRLAFGRQYTPQFQVLENFDPHGALTDLGMGTNWLTTRLANNLLSYSTPRYRGFSLQLAYSPDLLLGESFRQAGWPRLSYYVASIGYQGEKLGVTANLGGSYLHGDLDWDGLEVKRGYVLFAELFLSYDLGFMKLFGAFNMRYVKPDSVDSLALLTTPMIAPEDMSKWTTGKNWTMMLGGEWKVPYTEADRFVLTWVYRNADIPGLYARLDKYSAAYYRDFNDNLTGYIGFTLLLNNEIMNDHDHFWGGLYAADGRYRSSLNLGLHFTF